MSTTQNQLSPEEQNMQKEYREPAAAELGTLDSYLQPLAKLGGYDLLESAIDNVQNLNPERKARKKIFLEENSKKREREELKNTLNWWIGILQSTDDVGEMVEHCNQLAEQADRTLKTNVKKALERTADLERSYRSVGLFFKNTESSKVKNVSFMNAELDQLKDLDNTRFIDSVREELVNNFDRLDLRNNYGILIIPGYLGSNKVVEKWAKIAQLGFTPEFGARPLHGAIRSQIRRPLSQKIIAGELSAGSHITLDLEEDELKWILE